MRILRTVNQVPGGLMVVPLFIGMALNTFFPALLQIGGFTQALTGTGYPTMLGMYLFTVGTKMTVRTAPRMLARGLAIMTAKLGAATSFALAVAHWFGGDVFGLSTLAVMVAMSDTNGGMFLALISILGDRDDAGTYVVQSIETGPFLTMVIFVGTGLAVIPWLTLVSVIAPIVAGALLGNLDEDIKTFFESHQPIIIPFMAFMDRRPRLRRAIRVPIDDWDPVSPLADHGIGSPEPPHLRRAYLPALMTQATDTTKIRSVTIKHLPVDVHGTTRELARRNSHPVQVVRGKTAARLPTLPLALETSRRHLRTSRPRSRCRTAVSTRDQSHSPGICSKRRIRAR